MTTIDVIFFIVTQIECMLDHYNPSVGNIIYIDKIHQREDKIILGDMIVCVWSVVVMLDV